MTRHALGCVLVLGLAAPAFALVTSPIPRLSQDNWEQILRKDPATTADMPTDPEKTIERITETARAVGDRLKDHDTSEDTRKKQAQLLKDIDALLKQQTPPQSGDGGGGGGSGGGGSANNGGGGSANNGGGGNSGGSKSNDSQENSGGSSANPKGGGSKNGTSSTEQKPAGSGTAGSPTGSRTRPQRSPREQAGQEPMPGGKDDKEPMARTGNTGTDSGIPKTTGNGGEGKAPPALPLDDSLSKQVWGHLPEKLRQQVSQYYREQYMPRYSELLRMYYSSLAETEKRMKK